MEAMGRLGWKDAWVVFTDDDNVTAVRRALADNRTAELADWDENILSELVRSLGEDVEIPGWTEEELAALSALNPEPVDVIERQLAHVERNSVRKAYNHAEYLPQRREMMAWWGKFLWKDADCDGFVKLSH